MKPSKFKFLCGILATSSLMASYGCSSESEPQQGEPQNELRFISLDGKSRAVAEELGSFYVDFTANAIKYADENPSSQSKNVVVSPLSVSMVLGMFANGADDSARESICRYLGVSDLEGLNSLSATLLSELPGIDNQATLKLANSVWIQSGLSLNSNFKDIMTSNFGASIFPAIDINAVNRWCSENTQGNVPNMLSEISPDIVVLFINAMIFKGKWQEDIFDKNLSTMSKFYGLTNTSEVSMMRSNTETRSCYSDDEVEVFRIPFGNSAFSMEIILPSRNMSEKEALKLLTPENMLRFRSGHRYELSFDIPKFKVENKTSLDDILTNSGLDMMKKLVDLSMFNKKCTAGVFVDQGCSFEVDETGATAAASTILGGIVGSSGEIDTSVPQPKHITVDRPFYFFINEISTGACILSGRIADL